MKILKMLRNYLCYCGIEKTEYDAIKKEAYISNFNVWRILHCLMTAVFGFLFVNSLISNLLVQNMTFYLVAFVYSVIMTVVFFLLKKEAFVAQLLIYLSIVVLFLFGCLITQNKPDIPATTFIVMLLVTPMFMIDKPYFMGILLSISSVVYLIWMHEVKSLKIWQMDLVNIIVYAIVGFFIHVISNSIRIKEFVLTRKINIQKDTDELTGLKNKGALTREINEFLADDSKNKGIIFLLDIDRFKMINDTYGHDVGDEVIRRIGAFLSDCFSNGEIVGRFGGDEFVVFIKDTDSIETAEKMARDVISGTAKTVTLPDKDHAISVSIGIAIYHGEEKNYSEIFKKADVAMYKTKADRINRFSFSE